MRCATVGAWSTVPGSKCRARELTARGGACSLIFRQRETLLGLDIKKTTHGSCSGRSSQVPHLPLVPWASVTSGNPTPVTNSASSSSRDSGGMMTNGETQVNMVVQTCKAGRLAEYKNAAMFCQSELTQHQQCTQRDGVWIRCSLLSSSESRGAWRIQPVSRRRRVKGERGSCTRQTADSLSYSGSIEMPFNLLTYKQLWRLVLTQEPNDTPLFFPWNSFFR